MSTFNANKIFSYRYFLFYIVIFNGSFYFTINATSQQQLDTIFLRLYNNNGSTFEDAHVNDAGNLVDKLNIKKKTVYYIHGYTESANSTSVNVVVQAYLRRNDHNVIVVDWSVLAGQNYIQVTSNVMPVGKQIAIAIRSMIEAGLSIEKIYIVAHSMGAHVAGEVGRNIKGLMSIIALDPAGPLFNFIQLRHPLSFTDAKSVQIIHTDAGFYGISYSIGTVDFWPNYGKRIQPGCPMVSMLLSTEDFCSHHRSWVFYAESLYNETAFSAVECSIQKHPTSSAIVMGYATPLDARGNYHLTTSSETPYGLKSAGAKC